MKQYYNNALLIAMFFISGYSYGQKGSATVKGVLNTETKVIPLMYDGEETMLGDSKNVEIKADKDGRFEVKIQLDKPSYYRIRRNTLYLSPGDNLSVVIEENAEESKFSGKGFEANNYLRKRLFPKAGSYINAGRNAFSTVDSVRNYIHNESSKRLIELQQLKNVSNIFKEVETARIKADIINSYLAYPGYFKGFPKTNSYEEYQKVSSDMIKPLMPEIKQLYKEINDDRFLCAEVVRIVFSKAFYSSSLKSMIEFSPRIKELFETLEKSSVLSINPTKENVDEINKYISTMKYNDLKLELQKKVKAIGHLTKGSMAFDIELEDANGKLSKLSDLKGKYLYVDLWATWCGPCKKETPFFEKIREELGTDKIHFVALSVDTSKEAWMNYLKEHNKKGLQFFSNDKKIRTDWMLNGIPRFLLIDKDFTIIDAFAKRPSDPQLKAILKDLIK